MKLIWQINIAVVEEVDITGWKWKKLASQFWLIFFRGARHLRSSTSRIGWKHWYRSLLEWWQPTVASHVNDFPFCHGMRVNPSGRLPSLRESPAGSFVAETPGSGWGERLRNDVIKGVAPGNSACMVRVYTPWHEDLWPTVKDADGRKDQEQQVPSRSATATRIAYRRQVKDCMK